MGDQGGQKENPGFFLKALGNLSPEGRGLYFTVGGQPTKSREGERKEKKS